MRRDKLVFQLFCLLLTGRCQQVSGIIPTMKIASMKNLGSASASMLAEIGIHSDGDLRTIGAVGAYLRIKVSGAKPSLNLLWAMEGALTDTHWAELSPETRSALLLELDMR